MSDQSSTNPSQMVTLEDHPRGALIKIYDPDDQLLEICQDALRAFAEAHQGVLRYTKRSDFHWCLLENLQDISREEVLRHVESWRAAALPAVRPQPPPQPQAQARAHTGENGKIQPPASTPARAPRPDRKQAQVHCAAPSLAPRQAQAQPAAPPPPVRPAALRRATKVKRDNPRDTAEKRPKRRKTEVVPAALMLRERWDPEMLSWCARSEGLDDGVPSLASLDPEGYIEVPYGYIAGEDNAKPPCGRLIAQAPSAQRAAGAARRLCQHQYYHDVDQVNSAPTIVQNLCHRARIPCPVLDTYVTQREACLQSLHMTRSEAKQVYQALLFGKSLAEFTPEQRNQLGPLAKELHHCRSRLLQTREGQAVRTRCEAYENISELFLFAKLVFEHECQAVLAMRQFWEQQGYAVGALIHDGLQVERRHSDGDLPMELLRACEGYVLQQTGLRLQLIEKSMRPTDADNQKLRNASRLLLNEHQAAQEVVLLQKQYLNHTPLGIAVFEPNHGTWSLDQVHNVSIALPNLLGPIAHRLQGQGTTHFLHQVHARQNMYKMLSGILPLQHDWIEASMERARFKLCFSDGYWDFHQSQFVPGQHPELTFLHGVKRLFPKHQPEMVLRVREELFSRPYSSVAVRDFVLIALARALAGDQAAKQGYFIIGPSNSGKGMVTRLLELALPGVVKTFDASCLCKDSGDDPAKDLGWLMPLWSQRIVIANEFNLRGRRGQLQRINSNVWKSIISGGTDKIDCRQLYTNASSITPQFTPFILANDMPEFDNPSDSGCQTRTVATYMDRHAVAQSATFNAACEFPADPQLQAKLFTPEYQGGLIWLLLKAFHLFQTAGHDIPAEIRAATAERLPTEGVWNAVQDHCTVWDDETKNKLLSTPANVVKEGWYIKTRDVYQYLATAGLQLSPTAICRELQRRGIQKYKTRHQGQVFLGLRQQH